MTSSIITVIPVFNGEKYIRQTLESVAAQSVRPDRVIVIDNCSTDGTENIVKSFAPIKCEWLQNPKNIGLFANCNRALEFAEQTNYLLLLCADDLIEPRFFEVMTSALDSCKARALAYCLDERIDEDGRHLSISGKATGDQQQI